MSSAAWLLLLGSVPALASWVASRGFATTPRLLVSASFFVLGGWSGLLLTPEPGDTELARHDPAIGTAETFGSSDSCRACHPGQYASWHDTFHRTMTQVATEETVRAPFDGRVLRERGRGFRLYRDGARFMIKDVDDGGERRIVMLTGSHNMQAFWMADPEWGLRQFPFVYLLREERWMANSDSFLQPEMPAHADFERYVWDDDCASCHSTGGPFDAETFGADVAIPTVVSELGIACEACHGAARDHIEANRDPLRRYQVHAAGEGDPTVVNPSRLDGARSAAVCGRCHTVAEYLLDGPSFAPGMAFEESYDHAGLWAFLEATNEIRDPAELPDEPRDLFESFWTSGAVRVAGREFDGLARSECFLQDDLGCITCHRVHGGSAEKQLPPDHSDAQMCASCHAETFEDIEAHTHHAPESAGSACTSCHMPYTSYGLLMATRSHRLDSPLASGVDTRDAPSACNLCHLDRSLSWTADHLMAWYLRPSPPLPVALEDIPAGDLWLLRGDAVQRVLTAWHLRQPWVQETLGEDGREALEPALITLFDDPVSVVRQVAGRTLAEAHPDWSIEMEALSADAQPAWADERRGGRTGALDVETFDRLASERIDFGVSIPE